MKIDLSTQYLGLPLDNPLVPSASPLTSSLEGMRRLADAGAGAVVMGSLFEEQVDLQHELRETLMHQGADCYAEAMGYFPTARDYRVQADDYLLLIESARKFLHIPLIASLNGCTEGGWIRYAERIERAGAQALELNLYHVAADPERSASEVEKRYLDIVARVRDQVRIPLAVKVGPQFSSPVHFARRLREVGADGIVLFNRFYQSDLDLERLEVTPRLELSRSYDLLMPLTWTAIMFGRVDLDLALSGGVHTHLDVLKALMAGATVVQVASELIKHGPGRLIDLLSELRTWMGEREYHSVEQLRGSMSQRRVGEPEAFLRANYVKTLQQGGARWLS